MYSYRRIMDPATGAKYANILYPIKDAEKVNKGQGKLEDIGVKAVDDKTARDHPRAADPLLHRTADPPDQPSGPSRHRSRSSARTSSSRATWCRTAPTSSPSSCRTRTSSSSRTRTTTDAKNVKIDTVNYFPIAGLSPRCVRRYEAGELDSMDDLPADQMKSLKERFKDQVKLGPYLGTWFLRRQLLQGPVQRRARAPGPVHGPRPRVHRRADLGPDRCSPATRSCLRAWAITASPPTWTTRTLSPIDREDKAKALLKEAGFGPGKPLKVEIRYNTTDNNRNTVDRRRRTVEAARRRDVPSSTPTARPTSRICATAATSTSLATAGSPITPIRKTSCSCSRATTRASTTASTTIPNSTAAEAGGDRARPEEACRDHEARPRRS